jgi:glycerophosphoryl diester phosphodiesterase
MSLIIGHRGARGLSPENTLASLQKALAFGVHEIEIDIRVTKDGICILNHDPYLHDASGSKLRNVKISEHTFAELQQYRPDLTTLEDAITTIKRRVPLVIEVKPRVSTAELISVLKHFLQHGWRHTDFLVASFSQRALQRIHAALPDIEIVVNERVSSMRATWRARRLGTKRLAINHHNIWSGSIHLMHRRGFKITTFSLNDPKKAARWTKRGLHGVITDFPDRFVQGKKPK